MIRLRTGCVAVLLVAAQLFTASQAAEERTEVSQELSPARLVEQLGDSRFIQRQLATEALTQIGLPALEAVRGGIEHIDPEVRFRCRQILRAIRHLERQRLINSFIAGLEFESANELPGWPEYKVLAGETADARALYVQMLESEWAFLDAVFQNDMTLASTLLSSRCQGLRLSQPRQPVAIGSIAALMFVASLDGVTLNNQNYLMTLCYRNNDFDRAMRAGSYRDSLRQLVGALVGKNSTDGLIAQRLSLALRYDLTAGLKPSRHVLGERLGTAHDRQYAILVVAKLGEDNDDVLVQTMLDDTGVVASHHRVNNVRITTQVRDIALAALIYRAGKDFGDYGLPQVSQNSLRLFQTTSVGFASDTQRDAAIDKWRQHATK